MKDQTFTPCCGTCYYNEYDQIKKDYQCGCYSSEYFADWTDYDTVCDCYSANKSAVDRFFAQIKQR